MQRQRMLVLKKRKIELDLFGEKCPALPPGKWTDEIKMGKRLYPYN